MNGEDSILESVFDYESTEDVEMEDMEDMEDGELIEDDNPKAVNGGHSHLPDSAMAGRKVNEKPVPKKKKKKKKNKKNRGNPGSSITNINKFVLDVSRRLKEKKSYLVYAAVGCLGVDALNDLVKEVDAIQACGGQKTADEKRYRSGGGVLWNILKVRDPNSYREIMKKGKEFEKQFNPHNVKKKTGVNTKGDVSTCTSVIGPSSTGTVSGCSQQSYIHPNQLETSNDTTDNRVSVHDRVRMPVVYDDLVGEGDDLQNCC